MPRPGTVLSDMSDPDMESLAETELLKLQRRYRIMENERNAYTENVQYQLRKHKMEISLLSAEREELVKNLSKAESIANYSKDEENREKLMLLSNSKDLQEQEIEYEKKKIAELEAQIREWEKKNRKQQQLTGGEKNAIVHTELTVKKVRVLENRLDQAIKNFNTILAYNRKLRGEIDTLRAEKEKFDLLYKKLDKEKILIRKEMTELIEQATNAYDSREDAQAKMILLKEKAEKDIQQHHSEMKELIRILDHDRNLRKFMGIKSKERPEDPQLVEWRQRKEQLEAEKKKEHQEDSVERYEAAFEKIKLMTGEDNLEFHVQHYIEVEDRNFAFFNYVNEQNNQIEVLQEQIQELTNRMKELKEHGIKLEEQQKIILEQLEEKQMISHSEADSKSRSITEVLKILDQLKSGILNLFNKIGCDRSPIEELLGSEEGVTEINLLQYLGIIEQKTNELLSIQTFIISKDYDRDYDPKYTGLLGAGPIAQPPKIPVFPPSVGDQYESSGSEALDDDVKPLTRSELKQRVMKTVKKRESDAKKESYKYDLSNAREKTQKQKK